MSLILREGRLQDAEACGRICFEAFAAIATAHNFAAEIPSPEIAVGVLSLLLSHAHFYVVVAERDGEIVGSNALDERCTVAGIGPITVTPRGQNSGVGRELMLHVLDRATQRRYPGVRLVQSAYHNRSLALYTKLGFEPREPLSCVQGPAIAAAVPGYPVRRAQPDDLLRSSQLCLRVHGHTREGELREAIEGGTATVVERQGRITGYATTIAFFGHAVAETNDDLQALIAAAPAFGGPGFLVPTRSGDLLRWCLRHGLRIVQPMTLMSMGLYSEPRGAYLPSITY